MDSNNKTAALMATFYGLTQDETVEFYDLINCISVSEVKAIKIHEMRSRKVSLYVAFAYTGYVMAKSLEK